jgi:hypothetical protein
LNNNPDATPFPQGNGYATLTMSGAGAVTIVGKLADGSPISYSNYLSLANHLPVFIPLYGNMGFLFGDVVFDPTQAETDASDVGMLWLKPSEPESLYYPSGWPKGISVDLLASKYVVPMKPETALGNSETPLTIALADGDLQSSTSNSASIKANGLVTVPPSTPGAGEVMGLKALFTTSTGLLTGSFTHPVTKNTVSFTGVALQKMNSAEGYFLVPPPKSASAGTFPSSGSVMITTQ